MKPRHLTTPGLLSMLILAPAAVRSAPSGAVAATGNSDAATQDRIVFQFTEEDSRQWNTMLANVSNVQEELAKVEIAVVAIGPGLGMLKADALTANRVQDAKAAGVRFVACGNTMKAQHLTKDDMIDGIEYAKAGHVEVMRLQQQGWAYMRP